MVEVFVLKMFSIQHCFLLLQMNLPRWRKNLEAVCRLFYHSEILTSKPQSNPTSVCCQISVSKHLHHLWDIIHSTRTDIWGAQIYRGQSYGQFFEEYQNMSSRPLLISEVILFIQLTSLLNVPICSSESMPSTIELNQSTRPCKPRQQSNCGEKSLTTKKWGSHEWNLNIFTRFSRRFQQVSIGGVVFTWQDEWWKGREGLNDSTHPDCPSFDSRFLF